MALQADLIGIGRHATNEVVAVLHLNEDHLGEILWHPGQFFVGCDQLPARLWSMSSVLPPVTGNVSARRTRSTVNSAIAAANAAASNAAAANPSAKAALPICQTLGRSASGTVPTMHGMSPDVTCLASSAALAVSGALPGGDPLAAALAAGETPSPEMVAAAGAREGIRPLFAVAWLAGILLALGVITMLHSRQMLTSKVNFEMPPDALAVQARKTIQQIGITGPVADRVWGFDYDGAAFRYLRDHAKRPLDWSVLANGQPALVYFSYRESPRPLEPRRYDQPGVITADDPPPLVSGMAHITLDLTGRLRSLSAVPPQSDTSAAPQQQPDPAPLFSAAALEFESFQPGTPQWTPLAATDTRAAWTGAFPGHPESPIRVEAAWWHSKPVYFQIIGPWTNPDRMPVNTGRRNSDYAWLILTFGRMAFAALMAWRNLRMRRGDRHG